MSGPEDPPQKIAPATEARAVDRPAEPPVVARMVVEIRSDGRMTIARGALEDGVVGQTVAVEARGTTPLALALTLARSLLQVPAFAAAASRARALLPGRRGGR